jgi:hypothetical protein
VATNLFVAAAIFRRPFVEVARSILPTLGIICGALLLLIYVPTVSTGPLNLREGRPIYDAFPWEGKVEAPPAAEAAPAEGGAPAEERPMTLQEMMEKARKEREAAEAAAAGQGSGAAEGAPVEGAPAGEASPAEAPPATPEAGAPPAAESP